MKRFELEPGSGLDNGYSAHMAEDDYGDYVLFKDAQALQSRVAELETREQRFRDELISLIHAVDHNRELDIAKCIVRSKSALELYKAKEPK